MTRQKWKNTQKLSLEFRETSIFYVHQPKRFRETIYFSRKITITIPTKSETTNSQLLNVQSSLSQEKFKFLGARKGPTTGFLS